MGRNGPAPTRAGASLLDWPPSRRTSSREGSRQTIITAARRPEGRHLNEQTPTAAPVTRHPLSNAFLDLHAERAAVPTYDRAALAPAVVHLGVGGFHRAHQALYLDELAERRISADWGIVGVGFRRRRMKEALSPQDWLYTVVERDAEEFQARVVGAMVDYLFAPDDPEAVLCRLADPQTRIVTLTVTGCAYEVGPATEAFKAGDPALDAGVGRPSRTATVLDYIVEGLRRRRERGRRPFSVLSCDNVPANGTVARAAVVTTARLRDPGLADWIDACVAFPSSVVDRITPQTTPAARELVARELGIADRWPVVTEPFTQWIVEDSFSDGRPPLEEVGVQLVSDIAPYELAKKRLLNGSHCALGYLGYLAGHRRTDEAISDPLFGEYIATLMDAEVSPLLDDVPGVDLEDYKRTLIERFANPAIGDRLVRLCARGSTKMPAYLLPSIHDAIAAEEPHELLTLAVAGWFRYLRGVDPAGRAIEIEDALGERLSCLVLEGGDDPRPLLAERSVFGELGEAPQFVAALGRALRALRRDGPRATIDACLASELSLVA